MYAEYVEYETGFDGGVRSPDHFHSHIHTPCPHPATFCTRGMSRTAG